MVTCRCNLLNGLSGDLARDYVSTHLQRSRVDGMGRPIHICPDLQVEWTEEREPCGYAEDVIVLRRAR
jgi:hypothetical protein